MLPRLSAELIAELEASEQRVLSAAEFEARVRAPWSEVELEDFTSLIRWFARRYPSAGERLRAQRSRHDQWRRNRIG